jgi:hypothetical protein
MSNQSFNHLLYCYGPPLHSNIYQSFNQQPNVDSQLMVIMSMVPTYTGAINLSTTCSTVMVR